LAHNWERARRGSLQTTARQSEFGIAQRQRHERKARYSVIRLSATGLRSAISNRQIEQW